MRMRRRVPFEGLRIYFGVSSGSAHAYYVEMLKLFHSDVVPRLLRPFSVAEIDILTPAELKTDLPGARFIVDLTAFNCNSKRTCFCRESSTRPTTTSPREALCLVRQGAGRRAWRPRKWS